MVVISQNHLCTISESIVVGYFWNMNLRSTFCSFPFFPTPSWKPGPSYFFSKWKAGAFSAFGTKLRVIRKIMLGDLERQRCQGVSLKLEGKGTKFSPENNKKGENGMDWGEGDVSERGSERRFCSAGPQSFQIILLLRQEQKQQSLWTSQGPWPQPGMWASC